MNINLKTLKWLPALAILAMSCSCSMDDDEDDNQWKIDNENYFNQQKERTENGEPYYVFSAPDWAPGNGVLIRWHHRNPNHENMLKPLDNSKVKLKYQGRLYDETVFDSSYASTDSAYTCTPSSLVSGFWSTLTQMVPGDSVTVVIPPEAGYRYVNNGTIKAYSVLVFDIKLKEIVSFDK